MAHAGYIEVPDVFMERLNPYRDHRLEITVRDGTLVTRKKTAWQVDQNWPSYTRQTQKNSSREKAYPSIHLYFHVRYYWEEPISAQVLNPEINVTWGAPTESRAAPVISLGARINTMVLSLARAMLSQRSRNSSFKLDSLLAYPSCRSTRLDISKTLIHCRESAADYPIRDGLPVMFVDSVERAIA